MNKELLSTLNKSANNHWRRTKNDEEISKNIYQAIRKDAENRWEDEDVSLQKEEQWSVFERKRFCTLD